VGWCGPRRPPRMLRGRVEQELRSRGCILVHSGIGRKWSTCARCQIRSLTSRLRKWLVKDTCVPIAIHAPQEVQGGRGGWVGSPPHPLV
jgi:hypothetical protein